MSSFSKKYKNVFFVQIGSFDGVSNDPLHKYVIAHRWSGLLVEPLRESFETLLRTYKNNERLIFENVAIAKVEGYKRLWRLKNIAPSPAWHGQLSSFRREVILSHATLIPDVESLLISVDVRCTSIASLLDKHKIQKIELLHIDAEGYDFEILKTFDFDLFRPAIVLYEHAHLSAADKLECSDYLKGNGYSLIEEGTDSIGFL